MTFYFKNVIVRPLGFVTQRRCSRHPLIFLAISSRDFSSNIHRTWRRNPCGWISRTFKAIRRSLLPIMATKLTAPSAFDYPVIVGGETRRIWIRCRIDDYSRTIKSYEMCWMPFSLDTQLPPEVAWIINAIATHT